MVMAIALVMKLLALVQVLVMLLVLVMEILTLVPVLVMVLGSCWG